MRVELNHSMLTCRGLTDIPPEQIVEASNNIIKNKLNVIILDTIKGNNLHFANLLESHYLPINEEQYKEAKKT